MFQGDALDLINGQGLEFGLVAVDHSGERQKPVVRLKKTKRKKSPKPGVLLGLPNGPENLDISLTQTYFRDKMAGMIWPP